ncbi:hypothetical protein PTSG_09111 [Salpingoeca rosetta]|uniref:PH domain-containing protein n=1 Tax=Salpingoeca rosetta (strain ATCC 50818 / BSB-021) TaxID=946362 RepID=F2UMR6_SALR5|nr:uncharacterized protein PTSG_09111 [Salpingoeca rosetta]EGD78415.1 hypothetical protein PTSG_09111 [Salpingoeca rosetta]|eukprot:XP_004989364.1 hypothetical protein PTSG_09111 [Salpingoeca rosetta]
MDDDNNEQHRLTDGVSVEAFKTFLADLQSEFPGTYTEMTTEDACKQLVVPRTQQDNCAYVDLLRKQSSHEHVGKATVFVSHAWRYKIADVLNVLLEFAEEQAAKEDGQPVFFWFDLFMNNQNANVTANLPQEWWSTTFKESIANIGRVLLVLMPWRDPMPLTRAWCLWEIFCGISSEGTEVNIRLPKSEEKELEEAIRGNFEAVTDTLVRVQAERAEAFNPYDKDMIFKAIQDGVGFAALNQAVKDQLRAWCLEKAVAAVEAMRARGEDETEAFAELCGQVASVLDQFGEYAKAVEYYKLAKEIFVKTVGERHPKTASVYVNLGVSFDSMGNHDQAIEWYEKAKDNRVEVLGEKHAGTAQVLNNLGNVYDSKGEYDKAIEHFEAARATFAEAQGEMHPDTASTCSNLGKAYSSKGDYDKAIAYHETAKEIQLTLRGDKHPTTAESFNNLGSAYLDKGEYDKAIDYFHRARAVYVETLGRMHQSTAHTCHNLGVAYRIKGESEKAMGWYEEAKEIKMRTVGETHASTAQTWNALGAIYNSNGEHDKALAYHKMANRIYTEALGEKHPDTADTYGSLGNVYSSKGQYDKSIELYEKARAIYVETLGPVHPRTAEIQNSLGIAHSSNGEVTKAIEAFEKAREIGVATLGEEHPSTAMASFNIGLLHDQHGDMEQACAYMQQAHGVFAATLGADHPNTRAAQDNLQRMRQHVADAARAGPAAPPQVVPGHSSTPPLAGWLQKRGRWRRACRTCWVSLDDEDHLVYGKSAERPPKRRVPLSSVVSVELASAGQELRVAVPGRTFVFRAHASAGATLEDWCAAIRRGMCG